MAVNKPYGDGRRIGAVKNRTQVLNPQTGVWTKRDSETGRFMDGKKYAKKFQKMSCIPYAVCI